MVDVLIQATERQLHTAYARAADLLDQISRRAASDAERMRLSPQPLTASNLLLHEHEELTKLMAEQHSLRDQLHNLRLIRSYVEGASQATAV